MKDIIGKLRNSSVFFIIILSVFIVIVESAIMLFIEFLAHNRIIPVNDYHIIEILDPIVLSLVLTPILYVLIISRINKSEQRLSNIFETLLEGVALNEMIFNDKGEMIDYRVLEVNQAFYNMADFIADGPVVGRTATEIYKMDHEMIKSFWQNHKHVKKTVYTEMVSPISNRIFEIQTSPFKDNKFVTSFHDITEKKAAEEALKESQRVLTESQVVAGLGSYSYDIKTGKYIATEMFRYIFGISEDFQLNQASWASLVYPEDRDAMVKYAKKGFEGSLEKFDIEYRIVRPSDGRVRWIHGIGRFQSDENGRPVEIHGTIQDVTEKKETQERIQRLAYFDQLTDLPNRALLKDRFRYLLSLAGRNRESFAVLFIDLDQFKNINDTLGHSVGDRYLREVAKRLKSSLREEDILSRQGGDEYILLLPGVDAEGAGIVVSKISDIISQPCFIEHHELATTASIGIAIFPEDGDNMETLLKNADTAMYKAKKSGRNNFYFFTAKMQEQVQRNLALANALRNVIPNKELSLEYQPQIDIDNGKFAGVEALLRWHHPEFGQVSPAEFIPIAEDTGQIIEIGLWVIENAVRQAKRWYDEAMRPIVTAINISALQFHKNDLATQICHILDKAGLPHELIELELTEAAMMKDPLEAMTMINRFNKCGVKMVIDDFGTGYSSLNYLKQFKVDKIKIDRSFIQNTPKAAEDKAIVRAIISMAKSLGMKTLAEGVENRLQVEFLRAQGCTQIQGFYYSRPLLPDEVKDYAVLNGAA